MLTQITARFATTIRVFMFTLAALLLPVGLSACSGENSPRPTATLTPSGSATPTQSTATTQAPEDIVDPQQAAIAAYIRYRLAHAEAAAIPDPNYPPLEAAASAEALEATRTAIQRLVDNGWRSEGEPTFDVSVKEAAVEADPIQVAITDCSDSAGWPIIDAGTGEPVPDEEYGRRSIDALVELSDGRWTVVDIGARSIGSCLPIGSATR